MSSLTDEREFDMAVLCGIYGKTEPEYVGCVLDNYEHNGYNDSDWYAICWDEEQQKVTHVEYDTTRAGGGGYAKVDATMDVIRKVYRYYKEIARKSFDSTWNQEQAKFAGKIPSASSEAGKLRRERLEKYSGLERASTTIPVAQRNGLASRSTVSVSFFHWSMWKSLIGKAV